MLRLPHNANTKAEVYQYYATRARQFLHDGYQWTGTVEWAADLEGKACVTEFVHRDTGKRYAYYFILPAWRGKGYLHLLSSNGPTISHIEEAVANVGEDYVVAGRITATREYKLVEAFYNDRRAQRSQVFLMNHIDEGLGVMAEVGASDEAMRAFCLHPLLQNDADLIENYAPVTKELSELTSGAYVLLLAMEYRSVANEYLAHCTMREGGIRLSPIKDVNDMLIGDKVQNRKDFERYHAQTHDNRVRLAEYFSEWCAALGVADTYTKLIMNLPIDN